jgi:hypothetical protein
MFLSWIHELEYRLMSYCLKQKGKFWANHFFRNKEVNDLYSKLRKKNVDEVVEILDNA